MAVLCLMYHHTPKGEPATRWDVPLAVFEKQIETLIDAGINFVEVSAAQLESTLSSGMHVAVTFDDGHKSNRQAFEFLASKKIKPTSFVVAQWSQAASDYLAAKDLVDLSQICSFGAHGFSHKDLTSLDSVALERELTRSRHYLEDVLSVPVHTMALPGGKGDKRVLAAAAKAGYRLVCNSISDLNRHSSFTVNRPCVTSQQDAMAPMRWATANPVYWIAKRLRHFATGTVAQMIGEQNYAATAAKIKALRIR